LYGKRARGKHALIASGRSHTATVRRKLRSALVQPRPFIVAGEFFGPDRRTGEKSWKGRERRLRQPRKIRLPPPDAKLPTD